MQVLVVANHKGGVGKTTTVVNLAPAIAEQGLRVLIVEMDPQGNVGESFGLEDHEGPWVEDLLLGRDGAGTVSDAAINVGELAKHRGDKLEPAKAAAASRLWVLPASLMLREDQHELTDRPEALRELLEASAEDFDLVIIDPPAMNAKALYDPAVLAANAAIVTVQPSDLDVMGAQKQWAYIEQVLAEDNPRLKVMGVLPIRAQRRRTLFRDTTDALEEAGLPAITPYVPERTREISQAIRTSLPAVLGQPKADVTRAYSRVANRIVDELGLKGGGS